jgi:glycosyltransferase involved in cell wall biosynthesis
VRILLDYRPALRARTGVGEFVHELARALTASGTGAADRLTLFTASWRDRPDPALRATLGATAVVDWRIPVRALAWAWNRLEWPPIEWLAGVADVVHSQSPLLIPSTDAASLITIHDLHFLSHPEHSDAEIRRDFPGLVRDHARRADHVIVSSRFVAADVKFRLDVPEERITVCSPGAPTWAADVRRRRRDPHGDPPRTQRTLNERKTGAPILFLGTLEPRKNIGGLLKAYGILRSRRSDAPALVLAGGVRDSVRPILAEAQASAIGAHIQLPGYVTDTEKQRLYHEASMLVLPSFDEGFGLPVLEAMACGVPVVVSTGGSLPEVCGDAAAPVDPEDADGLAREMARLLDPDAAADATSRGLAQAATYSWTECARQARAAYAAALAARQLR